MKNPIEIVGLADTTQVSLIPEAHQQRDAAIAVSSLIRVVTDESEAQEARDSERELKRIVGEVEKARQAIKKPVLDLGREIDEKARQFVSGLEIEATRVNRLRLKYASDLENAQLAEQRRIEAEQRAQQEAIGAIERAAAEAEKAAAALEGEEARKATEKAEKLRWEAEKAEIEADQKVQEEQPLAVQTVAGKLKVQWDYEVLDAEAFVCAYPQFCKIEVKRREFLEALNGGFFTKSQFPEEIPLSPEMPPKPPGVRVFRSEKIR